MTGQPKRGLGRGLGALIPSATEPAPAAVAPLSDEAAAAKRTELHRPRDVFFGDPSAGPALNPQTLRASLPPARNNVWETAEQIGRLALPGDSGPRHGSARDDSARPTPGNQPDAPDGLIAVPGAVFAEVPIEAIRPNPKQPRTNFDVAALEELAASIKELGVLQPIVLRRTDGDAAAQPGARPEYELVMGERRWRAAEAAGLVTVPAIIRDTDDDAMLRDALLENLHRTDLNPLEEAAAYRQLLDEFGCSQEELARRIARSRPQISNTLRLLKLPPLVQRRVASGVLSAGHARALLGLVDAGEIERLAQRIVAEGLSVRAVEELVALAEVPSPVRRRGHFHPTSVLTTGLADQLSNLFETRVRVQIGKQKGRMTVEFATVADLNRILAVMAPGVTPLNDSDQPSDR